MATKVAAPVTIALKHLVAGIAGGQDLSKKRAEAILTDMVSMIIKHLKEGGPRPHRGPRHPPGPTPRRPRGSQPRHRRADPDQGEQEGRLPPGQ